LQLTSVASDELIGEEGRRIQRFLAGWWRIDGASVLPQTRRALPD